MIPLRLELKNFLSYKDQAPVLDMSTFHLACLCGDNGHGKSALFDAITWALWGQARAATHNDLVYQGERDMRVDLEFQATSSRYRVSRRFTRPVRGKQGATILELFQINDSSYQPISGNSVRETESKIRQLLRMDYETFINSAFIVQGRADMFTRSTPSKRKEILGEILGLSWYEDLADRSRAKSREHATSLKLLELQISTDRHNIGDKNEQLDSLIKIEQELEQLLSERNQYQAEQDAVHEEMKALSQMREKLVTLQTQTHIYTKDIDQRKASMAKTEETLNRLLQKSKQLHDLEAKLESATKGVERSNSPSLEQQNRNLKLQELDAESSHLKRINSQLLEEMMELRKKVDFLRDNDSTTLCPLCNQPLDDEGCEHLAANYELEGSAKRSTYRENETSIQEFTLTSDNMRKDIEREELEYITLRKTARIQYESLVGQLEEARTSQKATPDLIKALKDDQQSLKKVNNELSYAMDNLDSLERSIAKFSSIENRQLTVLEALRNLNDRQNLTNQKLGAARNTLAQYADLEAGLKEKEKLFDQESHKKGVYGQLGTAFGKAGVQALIIEQAIPQLEEYANDLLGRLTDYRMGLKMETQRENPSGGNPRETLDIKISDELGNRSYETYSGGEAFRINFALRIGLSRLLAYRSGAPLPTLFIDEGFGTQDSSGLERLVEAIKTIQTDFEKILVITHIDELKEAFPTRIEVTKTPNGSTFQVI